MTVKSCLFSAIQFLVGKVIESMVPILPGALYNPFSDRKKDKEHRIIRIFQNGRMIVLDCVCKCHFKNRREKRESLMAKKKARRFLSMVLAICVMAAGVPTSAFAGEGGTSETGMLAHYDFSELSGNVTEGTVIKDVSGSNHDAAAKGNKLTAEDSALVFPGGKYGSGAGYVELPKGMFDGEDTLTISMWMQNKTGAGNYAAFYFGTEADSTNKEMPTRYFLLNPMNPKGVMKSVMTNSFSLSTPYTTEVGPGSTGSASDGPVSSADWSLYSVVITPDDITGYLNGLKYKTYPLNVTVSDFGSDLVSYIGKSPYKDIFYAGRVKDLRIYDGALSDQDIAALYYGGTSAGELLKRAKNALTIPEAGNGKVNCTFVEKITLADSLLDGNVRVTWESDRTDIIALDGTVTNPEETTVVHLTARLASGSESDAKNFDITVIPVGDTEYAMVVDPYDEGATISQQMIGLFFEDINSAADGGLYPEMVKNYSFENYFNTVSIAEPERGNQYSYKLHWVSDRDNGFVVSKEGGLNDKNTNYAEITGDMTLENGGFAPMNNPNSPAMPIVKGEAFDFSVWTKADSGYTGTLKVKVVSETGKDLTDEGVIDLVKDGTWQKTGVVLEGKKTQKGKMVLTISGAGDDGVLNMDMVSLSPQDTYGYGDTNYAYGKGIRKDLVEKLQGLNPSFIRFPGGCIIEGNSGRDSYYNWENSIGPLEERKAIGNQWASDNGSYTNTYGYMQSYGFGYHEILKLCEDLGAEPFPILSAGVFCQFANGDNAPAAQGEELDKFAQHATNLIDYCWGSVISSDPTQREWAQKRVENGHEEAFNLNYVGIGNENWREKYLNNFDYIKDYVENYVSTNYPGRKITIISSAGPAAEDESYRFAWDWLNEKDPGETLVDEHYYQSKEFMLNSDDRYDYYTRKEDGGSDVFLGEYATHLQDNRNNNLESAICDAAYMTGIERNADIVRHASYAPLFEKIGSTNWSQNMIHFDEYDSFATPNYYTQQMFAQNYGTQVVNTTLEKQGANYSQNTGSPIIGTWLSEGYVSHVKVTREDGTVLLDDSFSANGAAGSKWAAVPGSTGSFRIANGKLTLTRGSGMNAVWIPEAINNPEWHDYVVEATVVKTSGEEGFLVGAGAKDTENYFWYNIGGWSNKMTAVERARTGRGKVVIGNSFYKDFSAVAVNDEMKVTFNYGVNGKIEAGYVSATTDKSKDFSGNLKPYQNDIYQVCSKDDEYIYLKLVNHDSYAKDITLTYPCILTSDQAEIICMSGKGNEENTIGNEQIKPVTSTAGIVNSQVKYLVPAMSFSVIKVPYQKETRVSDITLDRQSVILEIGESITLNAQVLPEDASDPTVEWTSSRPDVATVENGTVKALKAGDVMITAKAGAKTASCAVTVKEKTVIKPDPKPDPKPEPKPEPKPDPKPEPKPDVKPVTKSKIKLNVSSIPLRVNQTTSAVKLKSSTITGDKIKSAKTSSKKTAVVKVKNGKLSITGKRQGKAIIAVTGSKGGSAKVTVKVTKKEVATKSLKISKNVRLKRGKKITLNVTRNPITSVQKLIWTSSNKKTASVKNGVVKGIKKGRVTITVKSSNGKKAKCFVKVI